MPHKYNDLTGQRFGRLTVIQRTNNPEYTKTGKVYWDVICDCSTRKTIRGTSLTHGISQSCGCLQKEQMSKRAKKHGGFGTRLYNIWDSMRQRCLNPNCRAYKNYGERGIKITSDWDDFQMFEQWQYLNGYNADAKYGECTLDRIDVNSDYCPDNCRWITMKQQSNNKRNTIRLTYNDETHTLKEWQKILNVKYETLWGRYKRGWNADRILTQKVNNK